MSARRQTKGRVRASERKDIKKARVRVCARVETRTGYKYSYGKYTVNPSKLKIISSSFVVVVVVVTILEDDFTRDKEKVTKNKNDDNKQTTVFDSGLTKPNAFERKRKEETKRKVKGKKQLFVLFQLEIINKSYPTGYSNLLCPVSQSVSQSAAADAVRTITL